MAGEIEEAVGVGEGHDQTERERAHRDEQSVAGDAARVRIVNRVAEGFHQRAAVDALRAASSSADPWA